MREETTDVLAFDLLAWSAALEDRVVTFTQFQKETRREERLFSPPDGETLNPDEGMNFEKSTRAAKERYRGLGINWQ